MLNYPTALDGKEDSQHQWGSLGDIRRSEITTPPNATQVFTEFEALSRESHVTSDRRPSFSFYTNLTVSLNPANYSEEGIVSQKPVTDIEADGA